MGYNKAYYHNEIELVRVLPATMSWMCGLMVPAARISLLL